ncbi:hypothetical protein ACJMK2_001019 [Sinanodonta woodiana]|uniref:Uncharacterized protein n=1 Tax=Sinanodonta woodiana TaxID=1069815 RepID=A0ABD3XQZ3_SINWO
MCGLERLAQSVISSLKLPYGFLKRDGHVCFCQGCQTYLGRAGFTSYNYPEDWYLFRVNVSAPPGRSLEEISNNWELCYHGTEISRLESILRMGLKTPGECYLHGNRTNVLPWRFKIYNAPDDFDADRIFLSPSIRYASCDSFSLPYCCKRKKDGLTYRVKVVLMVHIRPGSYAVSANTSGGSIDPWYSDNSIEWATNESNSVVVMGVLVKFERYQCVGHVGFPCLNF